MKNEIGALGKRIARDVLGALTAIPTTRTCPGCKKAGKVYRILLGRLVLGHTCRACKWERAEA